MQPDEVKAIRRKLGLTQNDLADILRLGIDGARVVRHWEMGTRNPSGPVRVLLKLFDQCPKALEIAQKSQD